VKSSGSLVRDVFIAGTGTYLPGDPVPPERIEEVLGKVTGAPERIQRWIERTGPVMREILSMERYHYAIDPRTGELTEDNVSMAVKAATRALAAADLAPGEVGFIAYGSPHMDQMPTPSVRIQESLGIASCAEVAVHANCSSAYKALHIAHHMLRSGVYRTALVLSSNLASSELRASYFNQPRLTKEALFLRWFLCDGAGAVVLDARDGARGPARLDHTVIESVGGQRESRMFNQRPAYWMNPRQEFEEARHHLLQVFQDQLSGPDFQEEGRSVFLTGLDRFLKANGIEPGGVRYLQVNLPSRHIAEALEEECRDYGFPPSAFYNRLDRLGYSGPPMAFICLDTILREEGLDPGDVILSFALEVSKFMLGGYAATASGP
jgi:3-oxoacyl-[acyl-carrier-protein] synthase III